MQDDPTDFRPSPIPSWGCASVLASVILGAIAWRIAYGFTPDPCAGASPGTCAPEPDEEFHSLVTSFSAGLITFLLIQLLFTLLLIRTHKKNRS